MKSKLFFTLNALFPGTPEGKPHVPVNPVLLKESWPANWITHPGGDQKEYGVYFFRKKFYLKARPKLFHVHVSADNRYRLMVNGVPICNGPARGDLFNWFFESVDLAPYLVEGQNVIAAQVWNMGKYAPTSLVSNQTAFLLQGDSMEEDIVDTDQAWKVYKSLAHRPCALENAHQRRGYTVVGPGDQVDANYYPWGWEGLEYKDDKWEKAVVIASAVPAACLEKGNRWPLSPRTAPLLDETLIRFVEVRRVYGLEEEVPRTFLRGASPVTVPRYTEASILIDQSYNTVAYPQLILSGGKNATVKLTYAEALFDVDGEKGDRGDILGKQIVGNYDIITSDGAGTRVYRPLWFKAYRYIQLDIKTYDQPLVIKDFHSMRSGSPMKLKAHFSSNDQSMQEIWNVGWRTVQHCAGESFSETPYYEQLQYTGDSRIQALIALYTSGDDRLMRKCIVDFYNSRTPEGLSKGRYAPSKLQIIPTFSLFWVSIVHDYWMHCKDDHFIKGFLQAIIEVMDWYGEHMDPETNMVGPLTWWSFVDWDNYDGWGTSPGTENGNSAIVTLQLAYTLNQAADLFKAFKNERQELLYRQQAQALCRTTYELCFDQHEGMMADSPQKLTFSQHAGVWAVLSGALSLEESRLLLEKVIKMKPLGKVTFFYRFYLNQALKKVGMADRYYSLLGPWRKMLKDGLTTFSEQPEPTRSNYQAWSASPNYDFLATICGIMPELPGFARVLIQPALGELTDVSCRIPHPEGTISATFKRKGEKGLLATIILPERLTGTLVWNEKNIILHGGEQDLDV
ncbi:alpha-L-rhamnosidase-related protein [Pedobacter sp. AW31-3R]|uniref:alpha-L-rhamnosidase-related protein n=1 Tax=Pedobacter sp. AW31-3R TaxID=3445781 RepID=UPI003F9F52BB